MCPGVAGIPEQVTFAPRNFNLGGVDYKLVAASSYPLSKNRPACWIGLAQEETRTGKEKPATRMCACVIQWLGGSPSAGKLSTVEPIQSSWKQVKLTLCVDTRTPPPSPSLLSPSPSPSPCPLPASRSPHKSHSHLHLHPHLRSHPHQVHQKQNRSIPRADQSRPFAHQYLYESAEGMWSRFVDTWFYQRCDDGLDERPGALSVVGATADSASKLPEVLSCDRKVTLEPSLPPKRPPRPLPHCPATCPASSRQGDLRKMIIDAMGGSDERAHLLQAVRQQVLWLPFELAGSIAFDTPYNIEDMFMFPEIAEGLVHSASASNNHTAGCGSCSGCGLLSLVPVDEERFNNWASSLSSASEYAVYITRSNIHLWQLNPCQGCIAAGVCSHPSPPHPPSASSSPGPPTPPALLHRRYTTPQPLTLALTCEHCCRRRSFSLDSPSLFRHTTSVAWPPAGCVDDGELPGRIRPTWRRRPVHFAHAVLYVPRT